MATTALGADHDRRSAWPLRHVTGLPRVTVGSGFASATDRGTALHLAMRAALIAPRNEDAVAAATGLTPDEVANVSAQAEALRDWLRDKVFTSCTPKFRCIFAMMRARE